MSKKRIFSAILAVVLIIALGVTLSYNEGLDYTSVTAPENEVVGTGTERNEKATEKTEKTSENKDKSDKKDAAKDEKKDKSYKKDAAKDEEKSKYFSIEEFNEQKENIETDKENTKTYKATRIKPSSITSDSIVFKRNDEVITAKENFVNKLFDDNNTTTFRVYGKNVGETTFYLTVKLGSSKSVGAVQIDFPGNFDDYLITAGEIYVGSNESSLYSGTPCASYSKADISNYSVQKKFTAKSGTMVGFKFTDFVKSHFDVVPDNTSKYKCDGVISELKIYGSDSNPFSSGTKYSGGEVTKSGGNYSDISTIANKYKTGSAAGPAILGTQFSVNGNDKSKTTVEKEIEAYFDSDFNAKDPEPSSSSTTSTTSSATSSVASVATSSAAPASSAVSSQAVSSQAVSSQVVSSQAVSSQQTSASSIAVSSAISSAVASTEPACAHLNVAFKFENGHKIKYCKECGAELEKTPVAHTHNFVLMGQKAATYFAKGYSGDQKCSCGVVYQKGKTTAKKKLKKSVFKLTKGTKCFKITIKKVKGAKGFNVQYKKSKKVYKKTIKTSKKCTKKVKNLKKGKYKVRIRAYNKSKKKSNWTKWKSVKVK